MNLHTAAAWIAQRGTWPTTVATLTRDLGVSPDEAHTALHHLKARGTIVCVRRPTRANNQHRRGLEGYAMYVHRDVVGKQHKETP